MRNYFPISNEPLRIETRRRRWSRLIPEGSHHRFQSNYHSIGLWNYKVKAERRVGAVIRLMDVKIRERKKGMSLVERWCKPGLHIFFFFVHVEINKFLNEVGTKFIIIQGTEISMCVNFIYDRWIRDYFTTKKIIWKGMVKFHEANRLKFFVNDETKLIIFRKTNVKSK